MKQSGIQRFTRSTLAASVVSLFALGANAQLAPAPAPQQCFLVSDQANAAVTTSDILVTYEPSTDTETTLGLIEYPNGAPVPEIEAIAIDPFTLELYAADADTLGVINTTAVGGVVTFTPPGGVFTPTPAVGVQGPLTFDDVDGLTFDPIRDILYGCARNPSGATPLNDVLFQIDRTTGAFIPGTFPDNDGIPGPDDYLQLGIFGGQLHDCDDLGVDPQTGTLYVIINASGVGDQIGIIDLNNGTTLALPQQVGVDDLEGLTFDTEGRIVGSTGNGGAVAGTQNSFVVVNKRSGASIPPTTTLNLVDYESIKCLVPNCGNGVIDGDEQCDDGNIAPGDGCSAVCTNEVCGNGIVDLGEQCDDVNLTNGDGCNQFCLVEQPFVCFDQPSICNPTCGNNVIDEGEQCDDGNFIANDGCSPNCTIIVFGQCADGVVNGSEQCDDGNSTNGDGCNFECRFEPGYGCQGSPSNCFEICGNGVVTPSEGCDDDDLDNGDGCNSVCLIEDNFACNLAAPGLVDDDSCASGFCNPGDSECGNEAPASVNDEVTTVEDVAIIINHATLLANDVDPDGNAVFYNNPSATTNGTLVDNGDGTSTYTPNANFNGNDSFTYDSCDAFGECTQTTVNIIVTPLNDNPVAVDDTIGPTNEDTAFPFACSSLLGNDIDIDGDTLTVGNITAPGNGVITRTGDACVYTPDPEFSGTDTFTYEACDATVCDSAQVTIVVNDVNDAPVAVDDNIGTTSQGTPLVFSCAVLLNNDSDADGDPLTITNFGTPGNGTISNVGDVCTYTPDAGFDGTDTFTYEVCDPGPLCDTATVTVAVSNVNDAPVAVDDVIGPTDEDNDFTFVCAELLGNDSAPDGDALTVENISQPANGTLTVNGVNCTYSPNDDFAGPDTFTYQACDPSNACTTASVNIVVLPINDAPVAIDDNIGSTDEDTALDFACVTLIQNDTDVENDTLVGPQNFTQPANGTISQAGGTCTYTPDAEFSGTDTFTYEVCDATLCDTATVTVNVQPAADPPVAVDDNLGTTNENTPLTVNCDVILANDSDPDGDALTVNNIVGPVNGTYVDNGDGTCTYTPNTNFDGVDTFTYDACDPGGLCDNATVSITVNGVNQPPVALDDDLGTTNEATPRVFNCSVLLANDSDPEGDPLTVGTITQPANGTLVQLGNTCTYTPDDNFSGNDTFTYESCDDSNACTVANVTIEVINVNEPPVAVDDDLGTTPENTALVFACDDLLANDSDPDSDVLAIDNIGTPSNGTLVNNGANVCTYTPGNGFSGTATFPYRVCDPDGLCDSALARVLVEGVNDAPVALDDDIGTTQEETPLTFTNAFILSNDTDPDGDVLTAQNFGTPANGTLVDNGNGTLTYTPNAGFTGQDSFTYDACDPDGLCDSATVIVTVIAGNDAPVAVDDDLGDTDEDTPLVFDCADLLGNDSDPNNDTLSATNFTQPTNGTLVVAGAVCTYTPDSNYNGPDSFTYQACDDEPLCDTATVVLDVTPVNDAPVATDDNIGATPINTDLNFSCSVLLNNDNDVDGDVLTVNNLGTPTSGTITDNNDGTCTYSPALDFVGSATFTYDACDPDGLCDEATVTVVIDNAGQPPVAVNDNATTEESTPVDINVLANDSDPEDEPLTVENLQDPANGTVVNNNDGTVTYTPNDGFSGTDTFTYDACDPGPLCDTATVTVIVDPNCGNGIVDADEGCDDGNTGSGDGCNSNCLVENGGACGSTGLVGPAACEAAQCSTDDNTGVCGPNDLCGNGVIDANESCDDGNLIDGDGCNATCQCSDFSLSPGFNAATNSALPFGAQDENWTWSSDLNGVQEPVVVTDRCSGIWSEPFEGTTWVTKSPGCQAYASNEVVFFQRVFDVVDPSTFALEWDSYADNFIREVYLNGVALGISGGTSSLFRTPLNISITDGFVAGTNTLIIEHAQEGNGAPGGLMLDFSPYSQCTVGNVNDAPVPLADVAETNEDTPVTVNVLANDSDPDGDVLTVTNVQNPSNGTVLNNGNGTVLYTPNENFNGTDTFVYEVCDPSNACATTTVSVTVLPINDEPVAVDDGAVAVPDTPLTIDVVANDIDPDGDVLALTQITVSPTNGTAVIDNGQVIYTPDDGFVGGDTFQYSVCDPSGLCDTATVSIDVGGNNTAPVAVDDAAVTLEETPVAIDVLDNDVDPDGDTLVVNIIMDPTNGSVEVNANGVVTYTPDADFTGTDAFMYEACDPFGACDSATVTVVVENVNDAPVAVNDSEVTPVGTAVTVNVLDNDSDPDDDVIEVTRITVEPSAGTVTINLDGSIDYAPNNDFEGSDIFEYEICDPFGLCDTATVTINVGEGNLAPFIVDDEVETPEDTEVTIFVLVNDFDAEGDELTNPEIISDPLNGTVVVNASGSITYTPNPNFNGTDSFLYQSCDETGLCSIADVVIVVTPVNDAPTAVDDVRVTDIDTPIDVDVLANDSDVDGDPVVFNGVTTDPEFGTVTTNDDGTLNYAPDAAFEGTDTFVYEICDTAGICDDATVTIVVEDGGTNPDAVDDEVTTTEDVLVNFPVLDNDTDPEGDILSVGEFTQPQNGTVVLEADDTFTYTPDLDFVGTDTFTYEACDGVSCDTATVTITVENGDNDAPIAIDDQVSTPVDTPLTFDARVNDRDPEGEELTVIEIVREPSNGSVVIEDDGLLTYTPNDGFIGVDTFEYSVCDPQGACDTALVIVTVTDGVNNAPLAEDDAESTDIETPVTIAILDNDSDPDGDTIALTEIIQPENGSVFANGDGTVTYTPDAGFEGVDSFTYEICDPAGLCDVATVRVTVGTPPNEAPVAIDDAVFTQGPDAITVDVTDNDFDPNGDTLTPQDLVGPDNGTASVNDDGSITYTPNDGFAGIDEISYNVCDPAGLCDSATLLILVGGPDDNDGDGISNDDEVVLGTDPDDADSDDDGIADGQEPDGAEDTDGDGVINALDPDSDNDGLTDGTEVGVEAPLPGTDTSVGAFTPDADDAATVTDPLDPDTDNGGTSDGSEDTNKNGIVEPGEGEPVSTPDDDAGIIDSDGDGLSDAEETLFGSDPNDRDTDDDGIIDGDEPNWLLDTDGDNLVNVLDPDSDNDGIFDGTEVGITTPDEDTDEEAGNFVPDADPETTTSPLLEDTDRGGVIDGEEDANQNGAIDAGETDPNDPSDDEGFNDRDFDTIPDDEDNCPDDANTDQADEDGDGIGDVCDNGNQVGVAGGGLFRGCTNFIVTESSVSGFGLAAIALLGLMMRRRRRD